MTSRLHAHLLLLLYLLLFSLFVMSSPQYYWDIVPYLAASMQEQYPDPAALHQATYQLLAAELTASQFQQLISGEFAAGIHADYQALASQLPMYQSKPLYIEALQLLNGIGVARLDGLLILALLPALGILLIAYRSLCQYCHPCQAVFLVIVFAFATRLTDLTQGLVHNNLANFFVLAGTCLLLEKRHTAGAIAFYALALLTRTDNIFFICLIQGLLCWRYFHYPGIWSTREWLLRIGGLILFPLLYLAIASRYEQNWWRLFYHSLIESQVFIENFNVSFSWPLYWRVIGGALMELFSSGIYLLTVQPLFLLLLLLTVPAQHYRNFVGRKAASCSFLRYADIGIIILLVFGIYLLLFPLVQAWDRFFTHFYVLILISAAERLRGCSHRLGRSFSSVARQMP